MKRGIATWGSWVAVAMIAIGCGGPPRAAAPATGGEVDAGSASAATSGPSGATTPSTSTVTSSVTPITAAAPGAATSATSDGSAADAGATAPGGKPFAHNAEEATSFIDDAITSRSNDLVACVSEARTRRKNAHAKIVVEVGIDQEGHLLGVKLPKGEKADKALVDCLLAALRGAPFPRSHAGVITVRRTFEDQAVYK